MTITSEAQITTDYSDNNHELVIHIGGRFDFRALNQFRDSSGIGSQNLIASLS